MRSSTGQHFIALDHLRGFAAFLVVAWHFLHGTSGPVALEGAPILVPLALADEGHTGVALFMTLSGYLFAKLLNGRTVSYPAFFWNRFIRLAPLLLVVFTLAGFEVYWQTGSLNEYLEKICKGFVFPIWPNGGWSIATEIHFYFLLPFLLALWRRTSLLLIVVVLVAIIFRSYYHFSRGQVQSIAYLTIFGRVDQFVLGILAFQFSSKIVRFRSIPLVIFLLFTLFWWWFDSTGGFYQRPSYPSNSPIWVFIPTIEGMAYGCLVVWYSALQLREDTLYSRILQRFGEYSYSIYLLHFFVVFRASEYIHLYIVDLGNFYVALAFAVVFFCAMMLPGYASFKLIEAPFLRLRRNYIVKISVPDPKN